MVGVSPTTSSPRCREVCAWGSRSTRHTRRPSRARPAARLTLVVVLPTPPFWFITAILRIGFLSLENGGAVYAGKEIGHRGVSFRTGDHHHPDEIGRRLRLHLSQNAGPLVLDRIKARTEDSGDRLARKTPHDAVDHFDFAGSQRVEKGLDPVAVEVLLAGPLIEGDRFMNAGQKRLA